MSSASDILGRGPAGIADYEDLHITILAAEFGMSAQYGENVALKFRPDGEDEVELTTGAVAIVRKVKDLAKGGHLPVRVKVVSYPGQFGKPGFDITNPDDVLAVEVKS